MATPEEIREIARVTRATWAELGQAAGVSAESIKSYSLGRRRPSPEVAERLDRIHAQLGDTTNRWTLGQVVGAGSLLALVVWAIWGGKGKK